jgi:hypothetical protein
MNIYRYNRSIYKKNFWLDIRYARKAVPGISYDSLKGSIVLTFPENGLCKKSVNIVRLTLDPFFFFFLTNTKWYAYLSFRH